MYRQTWWCIYRQPPAKVVSPAESRALERQRQAEAIGKSLTSQYSKRGKFNP